MRAAATVGRAGGIELAYFIIMSTFFSAFTDGSVLQVLFIAILVGFAVQSVGSKGQPIRDVVAHMQKLIFKILNWILWIAPRG